MSKYLVTLGLMVALAGCGRPEPQLQQRLYHFGTEVDVSLIAPGPQAKQAMQLVDRELGHWHRRWHAWQTSELTELNDALQSGAAVQPEPDLAALIRRSQSYSAATDGLFNPALGLRIRDWGFARDDMSSPAPAPAAVDVAQLPRMSDLLWEGPLLRSRHPQLRLDLGGIAKGYALNRLREQLLAAGIHHALINLGGDVLALGRHRERPWTIAVQDPQGGAALAALPLDDGEQVFSSGTYARRHDSDRGPVHHIIDPRSGAPAQGNLAVTALGTDGEWLQVASKTLIIVGNDWPRWASRLKLQEVLVVTAERQLQITPLMAKRLERLAPVPAQFLVLTPP